jgi:hypothetical protein
MGGMAKVKNGLAVSEQTKKASGLVISGLVISGLAIG